MTTKWILAIALLAVSNLSFAAGWQDSQTITEYFIDGDDKRDRLYVAFDRSPNPDGCRSDARYARVDSETEKGKYLFSIILSAHGSQQAVAPKLEGCDEQERPIVTALRVGSN
jgi:hypothetical protein